MADNQVEDVVYANNNNNSTLDTSTLLPESGYDSKPSDESSDCSVLLSATSTVDGSKTDSSTNINCESSPHGNSLAVVKDEYEVSDSDDSDDDDGYGDRMAGEQKNSKATALADDQVDDAEVAAMGEFLQPDEESARAISALADWFFSEESIRKESYLVKHIRRNKQGFVSLKVINSLRKMKRLTRDYRVIGYSIKMYSSLLELNETETKVRRKDALTNPVPLSSKSSKPEVEVAAEYRTVVVMNLPTDKSPSIASVAELFSKCGAIGQIRIIQSVTSISGNVGKLLAKHASAGDGHCALVEFEKISDAKKSCKTMTDLKDWRRGLRVSLLVQRPNKEDKAGNNTPGQEGNALDGDNQRPPRKDKKNMKSRVNELSRAEGLSSGSMYSSSGSDNEGRVRSAGGGRRSTGRNDSPMGSDINARRQGPNASQKIVANLRSQESNSEDWRTRSGSFDSRLMADTRMQSPWALRRLKAQQAVNGGSDGNLAASATASGERGSMPCLTDISRVLRQPRGPDGTAGFKRGATISAAT